MYWIIDIKTGCRWANGATFTSKQSAEAACMLLVSKYGNNDLRVVSQ